MVMHGGSHTSIEAPEQVPEGGALGISNGMPGSRRERRATMLGLGALLATPLVAPLAGCASRPALFGPLFGPRIGLRELRLEVTREANDNMPLRIELVATKDEQLLAKLLTLSAAQWFDPLTNLRRDFPAALQTWDYELPPGASLALKPAPFAGVKAAGLVLFANYKGKGAYRLRLDPYRRATVVFGALDATVEGSR